MENSVLYALFYINLHLYGLRNIIVNVSDNVYNQIGEDFYDRRKNCESTGEAGRRFDE